MAAVTEVEEEEEEEEEDGRFDQEQELVGRNRIAVDNDVNSNRICVLLAFDGWHLLVGSHLSADKSRLRRRVASQLVGAGEDHVRSKTSAIDVRSIHQRRLGFVVQISHHVAIVFLFDCRPNNLDCGALATLATLIHSLPPRRPCNIIRQSWATVKLLET